MNPTPCRRCRAEAICEATARGWRCKCTVHPEEHRGPERKSRDKAVRDWDELQERDDE